MELVALGKAHTEIGRGLGRDIGADSAIANVAPVFWGTTMTAHLDTAQLIAFKLFDPRKGTMTVSVKRGTSYPSASLHELVCLQKVQAI